MQIRFSFAMEPSKASATVPSEAVAALDDDALRQVVGGGGPNGTWLTDSGPNGNWADC